MKRLLPYLPFLICLGMMLFMCLPMIFKRHGSGGISANTQSQTIRPSKPAELEEQIAHLESSMVAAKPSETDHNPADRPRPASHHGNGNGLASGSGEKNGDAAHG